MEKKKLLKILMNILKNRSYLSLIIFTVLLSCELKTERSFFINIKDKVVFNDSNWYYISDIGEIWNNQVLYDFDIKILSYETTKTIKCYWKDDAFYIGTKENFQKYFDFGKKHELVETNNYNIINIHSSNSINYFLMINRFRIDGVESNEYQVMAISKDNGFIGAVYFDDFTEKIDVESKVGKIPLSDSLILNEKIIQILSAL